MDQVLKDIMLELADMDQQAGVEGMEGADDARSHIHPVINEEAQEELDTGSGQRKLREDMREVLSLLDGGEVSSGLRWSDSLGSRVVSRLMLLSSQR